MSRSHALSIFQAALKAADPIRAVLDHVAFKNATITAGRKKYRLADFDRIRVIGAGKAGARMAQAIERLLGSKIHDGWVNVPDHDASRAQVKLKRIYLHQ